MFDHKNVGKTLIAQTLGYNVLANTVIANTFGHTNVAKTVIAKTGISGHGPTA
ncbi:hypothetical protein DPMN_070867 [Dreissena polymorpha]|uniref:Uncharacterized protein n=1 Tax=Dreissena polymorpha TaxID=45954 RepID=A0A9D4BVZ6_DREPO|nr:hypothetical protein DPMN_070867 [Dreissena polymorpha]